MDTLIKVVEYVVGYVNSIPASSWMALGTLLGGSAVVTGIVAWINRRRFKQGAEKLGKAMVTWVVAFLSALVSVLDFIINNGTTFGPFLPYFATHTVQVIGLSTTIYNVAKPTLQYIRDRQAGKQADRLERLNSIGTNLAPQVEAVLAPVPVTAEREEPSPRLLQL